MSTETIFFSYSREDSEFVLTLAKNLRKAGANIWLDQLDIKPGTRWDKSIETALEESNTLLVILSKSSVASTNVMDEVSFALEENKTVVPVLLEECDIPFRLRRLQFADFSSDQNKGLKTLAEALHLDGSVANKLTDTSLEDISISNKEVEQGKKIKQEVEAHKITEQNTASSAEKSTPKTATTPSNSSKSKTPIFIVVGVVAIAAILFLFKDTIFPDKDLEAWELALEKDSTKEYEFYMRTNPTGKYLLTAKDSIDSKAVQAKELADKTAWKTATDANTVLAFEKYLKDFGGGKYASEARSKIKTLEDNAEKVAEDNSAWNAAKEAGTINILAAYITNTNVLGMHKAEALAKINETGREGWLYYGRIDGEKMNNEVFDLDWREGAEVEKDMKPIVGDILVVKLPYKTYNRVGASQAEGSTGRSVKFGNKVLLLGLEERGSALFAKVKFD